MRRQKAERERSLRAKRDLSKIYFVPHLDNSIEMCPQPPQMSVQLFDYQRRAIARMLKVEEGVEVEINAAKGIRTRPRGGVLCEAVGMVCMTEHFLPFLFFPYSQRYFYPCKYTHPSYIFPFCIYSNSGRERPLK